MMYVFNSIDRVGNISGAITKTTVQIYKVRYY